MRTEEAVSPLRTDFQDDWAGLKKIKKGNKKSRLRVTTYVGSLIRTQHVLL